MSGTLGIEPLRRYEVSGGRWVSQTVWRGNDDGMTGWSIRADRGGLGGYAHLTVSVVHEDAVEALNHTLAAAEWLASRTGRQWYAKFRHAPIVAEESADV